ncbi:MAG: hydroxymethylglutaryl-CoA lyase [Alicyclobacillus sp.]|nr:hydroxymethylglutaryl-CoA lyase [Alicyclobacillus sp.]
MQFPERIELRDVTLRDGLQNERAFVPTQAKLELLDALVAAGFRDLEVTSFVRADRIPPLRDADVLAQQLPERAGVTYRALVPNARGLERLLPTPIGMAVVFLSASTAHNEANVQRTTEASLVIAKEVIREAVAAGRRVAAAIATSFVCPFTGLVPFADVERVADALMEAGAHELSVADTIGRATPRMVYERCAALRQRFPGVPLALHLHDPMGYGLANVLAAIQAGVTAFDVAQAGLGGCPYAPGAPGNLQASRVAAFLEAQGMETGTRLEALADLDVRFRQAVSAA